MHTLAQTPPVVVSKLLWYFKANKVHTSGGGRTAWLVVSTVPGQGRGGAACFNTWYYDYTYCMHFNRSKRDYRYHAHKLNWLVAKGQLLLNTQTINLSHRQINYQTLSTVLKTMQLQESRMVHRMQCTDILTHIIIQ